MQKCLKVFRKRKKTEKKERKNPEEGFGRDEYPSLRMAALRTVRCSWLTR